MKLGILFIYIYEASKFSIISAEMNLNIIMPLL